MRDVILTLVVVTLIVIALGRPWIGLLTWSWLGYMNPHRFTWGFAYNLPFVQGSALATVIGLIFSKEPKKLPWSPVVVVWMCWILWTLFTYMFALNEVDATNELVRTMKIHLMILVTLVVINTRERINALVWVMALSIAVFGIKGGIFTLATGGKYRVWGPTGSFIEGNNEIALALIMIIPLLRYQQMHTPHRLVRRLLWVAMAACGLSALGSYSRGALLAFAAMLGFLWLKSRGKVVLAVPIVAATVLGLVFMPDAWVERMQTIESYDQDASALGRINAWHYAVNLAAARPFTGGGFRSFTPELFARYAPVPRMFHEAHSIYFEVLGDQGYVGLTIYLLMAILTFKLGSRIIRQARGDPARAWAADLAGMLQVSMVGFAVGGAFLGLCYWDLPYQLMAVMVLTASVVKKSRVATGPAAQGAAVANEQAPAGPAAADLGPKPVLRRFVP
jgi:probable O-glycosylation ligase (exosortase A-associated)